MIVVSTGCPAGVGPEVSVAAASRLSRVTCVLVGDLPTLRAAAERVGVPAARLAPAGQKQLRLGQIQVVAAGPALTKDDRRPGAPSGRSGAAQLAYLETAYRLVRQTPGACLVTGPVNKAAIARSGARGARGFRGHTEWLRDRDGARRAVMCFWSKRLTTSLVTTHLPLSRVPRVLTARNVADACLELAALLRALGTRRPSIVVCALNPHAGEESLFGAEEARVIAPGVELARAEVGRAARFEGPIGAETALRLALAGQYDGAVAMYHDQATIPMKLVAFGSAVNVTMGLSIVRTSVDHGTGYDIAWTGRAGHGDMLEAMKLAARLAAKRR
jgi:4-hydroxythreonine-4-phosphate dehydrogenase